MKFEWGETQERAFSTLKDLLTHVMILSLPEGDDDFSVYSDASRLGLGCVLMCHTPKPRTEETFWGGGRHVQYHNNVK